MLGTFSGDGQLRVRYNGNLVADLPMAFLHDGLPRRQMSAVYREPGRHGEANEGQAKEDEAQHAIRNAQRTANMGKLLIALLSTPPSPPKNRSSAAMTTKCAAGHWCAP
ncbi:MAG: hypothetical protein R2867_17730 [Caldilineaceae bacterium]